jgi:hypothetical protein
MGLGEFATSLLLLLSAMLGINSTPEDDHNWEILTEWTDEAHPHFVAVSDTLLSQCGSDNHWINFPVVIHGTHQIFVDNILRASYGRTDFQSSEKIYSAPQLRCSELYGSTLRWEVTSYSPYFARFNTFPSVVNTPSFDKLLFISIGSSLPFMMLALGAIAFTLLVSTNSRFAFNFLGSCICWSIFALCMNGGAGLINLPMLYTHKIADSALWLAVLMQFRCFEINGWLSKPIQGLLLASILIALLLIALGETGDTIQFGTSTPFPALIIASVFALHHAYVSKHNHALTSLEIQINLITISVFLFTVIHDILLTIGAFDGMLIIPYGVSLTMLLLAVNANKQFTAAHQLRLHHSQLHKENINENNSGQQAEHTKGDSDEYK